MKVMVGSREKYETLFAEIRDKFDEPDKVMKLCVEISTSPQCRSTLDGVMSWILKEAEIAKISTAEELIQHIQKKR